MRTKTGRRSAAGLGIAALLVTGGAGFTGTANAAGGQTVVTGTGSASGQALHIEINIPGAPEVSEDVSLSTAQAALDGAGISTATLFKSAGPLAPVFDGVNQAVTAKSAGPKDASAALIPTQDVGGLIQIGAGLVKAHAATGTASASAKVAGVDVGLGGALAAPLQTAITQLNTQITTINTQVQPVLTSVINPLTGAVPTTGTPLDAVKTTLTQLPADLNLAVSDLKAGLTSLTAAGGVATISLISSENTVEPFNGGLRSTAVSKVGNVKLLGQLVTIDAITSTSTAAANGLPGGASASLSKGDIAAVKVGSLVNLKATVDGLTAELGNPATVAALKQALGVDPSTVLQPVIDQLNGLLGMLGVQVGPLGSQKVAAADGSHALASTNGVGITVGSPVAAAGAKPLIAIALVPSKAEVVASSKTTVTPITPEKGPQRPLAYTGYESGVGTGIGVALLLGAAFLRRRRTV